MIPHDACMHVYWNNDYYCIHEQCSIIVELLLLQIITVIIITAPYPPPNDVHISRVGLRFVTFSWSAVLGNCSTLVYQIMATNCGICPRSTTHTSVTCTSVYTGSQICSFRVQTDICDNIRGTASHPILATLAGWLMALCTIRKIIIIYNYCVTVPAAPQLHITPQYSYLTGNLTKIYIIFNESVSCSRSIIMCINDIHGCI